MLLRNVLLIVISAVLLAACLGTATPQTVASTPTGASAPPPSLATPPAETVFPPDEVQSSPLPTPTLSVPESLTTAELHRRLDPFGTTDRSCVLPCYNGLRVGQSGQQDVLNFYAWLGIGVQDLIPGDYEAVQDGSGRLGAWLTKTSDLLSAAESGLTPPLVDIYLESGLVQSIYVGWQYYPPYVTVSRTLEVLGQPAQVDLALVFSQDPPTYMLRLLYPTQQTGFAFYGQTIGDATVRQVCFSAEQVTSAFFGVFAPGIPPMAGLTYSDYLLPVEQTLSITQAQFAALATQEQCLNIAASLWTPWQALQVP